MVNDKDTHCCHGECDQGRECPDRANREPFPIESHWTDRLATPMLILVIIFVAVMVFAPLGGTR